MTTSSRSPRRLLTRLVIASVFGVTVSLPVVGVGAHSAVAVARSAPTTAQINTIMMKTVEVGLRSEHFAALTKPLTIKDGRGTGTLTAVIGHRAPTADMYGQLVFFWHNKTFIGWDANYESTQIRAVKSPAPGALSVTYSHYAAKDPLCCPSRKPVTIQFGWSGHILISNGVPPHLGSPVKVMRLR